MLANYATQIHQQREAYNQSVAREQAKPVPLEQLGGSRALRAFIVKLREDFAKIEGQIDNASCGCAYATEHALEDFIAAISVAATDLEEREAAE